VGAGVLRSEGDAGLRRGYAGYEFDPVLGLAGASIYHVRNRVYDAENGRWTKRDPLGYVDGPSLYEYCASRAVDARDPKGKAIWFVIPLIPLLFLPGCGGTAPGAGGNFALVFGPGCPAAAVGQMTGLIAAVNASCGRRRCGPVTVDCRPCTSSPPKPGAPPGGPIHLEDGTEGEATCNIRTNCPSKVLICTNRGDVLATMRHELTHVRQCCDGAMSRMLGASQSEECEIRLRLEYAAYLADLSCSPEVRDSGDRDCCARACGSARIPCGLDQ